MIQHRQIEVGDASLHVAVAGEDNGTRTTATVLLLHGVPELWYSWRHQLRALADAGYRVLAPDTRGCGRSTAPSDVAAYSMRHLIADVVGLLDAIDAPSAVLVGHDWGAETAWQAARAHPDRVSAVAALSVPYTPRSPEPPTQLIERFAPDTFSFVRYFQTPGLAEAELEADPRRSLHLLLYALSGDAPPDLLQMLFTGKDRDAKLLDGIPDPPAALAWLTDEDLDVMAGEYRRTGFTGALNRYRNLDRDWEELASLGDVTVDQPALFVGGERDSAVVFGDLTPTLDLPNLHDAVVLPGCGHWVQQERPAEVNGALVDFLEAITC